MLCIVRLDRELGRAFRNMPEREKSKGRCRCVIGGPGSVEEISRALGGDRFHSKKRGTLGKGST